MPYIPPHLRVSQDDRPTATPATPPSSSRHPRLHPHLHARGSESLMPNVFIPKSTDFVRRLIVLSCHDVEFARFNGETYTYLRERQLHTLRATTADDDENSRQNGLVEADESFDGLSLQEGENPARYIVKVLQKDFKEVLEKFKGVACVESVGNSIPWMWLKFGKLLFEGRSGLFKQQKRFTPKEAEINFERGRLLRTFDTCLSEDEFTFLHEVAHKSASEVQSKETFIIQFLDERRPDAHLWCVCSHFRRNEQSADAPKPVELALNLKKVRLSRVRHMVTDFACVGKSRDIRMLFYIEETATELTEEELLDLKFCYSKASVDLSVKGGLCWPLGSKLSASGRFKVVGSWHKRKTLVIGGGLRWSLVKCNKMEFETSTGRISYEVDVRPSIYHEFCKGREERTLEELLLSIEDLLHRVWADCI